MHNIQDILIILLAGYMTIDQNGPVVMSWFSVIVGTISGLIMGDLNTGLMIGGTFQLMSLGVAALGGASAPNYGLATIIGTFIAVRTGTGIDAAVGVGLPVGLLAIQLEVVVRIVNNFVAHKMQSDNNEGKWKNMNRIAWVGPLLCSLQTIIPTVIVVCFGTHRTTFAGIPEWYFYRSNQENDGAEYREDREFCGTHDSRFSQCAGNRCADVYHFFFAERVDGSHLCGLYRLQHRFAVYEFLWQES